MGRYLPARLASGFPRAVLRSSFLAQEHPEFGTELASSYRFDVSQEMITNPIRDDSVFGCKGEGVAIAVENGEGRDPRRVFVVPHHLS